MESADARGRVQGARCRQARRTVARGVRVRRTRLANAYTLEFTAWQLALRREVAPSSGSQPQARPKGPRGRGCARPQARVAARARLKHDGCTKPTLPRQWQGTWKRASAREPSSCGGAARWQAAASASSLAAGPSRSSGRGGREAGVWNAAIQGKRPAGECAAPGGRRRSRAARKSPPGVRPRLRGRRGSEAARERSPCRCSSGAIPHLSCRTPPEAPHIDLLPGTN